MAFFESRSVSSAFAMTSFPPLSAINSKSRGSFVIFLSPSASFLSMQEIALRCMSSGMFLSARSPLTIPRCPISSLNEQSSFFNES